MVTFDEDILKDIDRRAAKLGLTRSRYLEGLAQKDIASAGPLELHEYGQTYGQPLAEPKVRYTDHHSARRKTKGGK